jgi:hypothetical protein
MKPEHAFIEDNKLDVSHVERTDSNTIKAYTPAEAITYRPGTAEEKALLRKIDVRLLPILWLMYVFNYIDRTNIGVSVIDLLYCLNETHLGCPL